MGKSKIFGGMLAAGISVSLVACAGSASIRGESGADLTLEVDFAEAVEIGGVRQWIYAAGSSREAPVLLWLDGGPGGSELGTVRRYLGPLHEHFIVVCWDQRGTGKTRRTSKSLKGVTVERYVEDVLELSRHLAARFGREKIYLVGHSWGSIIGVMAAARAPELFAAYVGVGQQVNSVENDRIGWRMVRDGARAAGEEKVARTLEAYGEPPYTDGAQYFYLFRRLYEYSPHPPRPSGFDSTWYFRAREHALRDRIAVYRGLVEGVSEVYPQLADLDFERDVPRLDCPLFIVNGRYDLTCVATIAARWFAKVEAPHKELVWFENSGHNPCYQEPEAFIEFLANRVLGSTATAGAERAAQ